MTSRVGDIKNLRRLRQVLGDILPEVEADDGESGRNRHRPHLGGARRPVYAVGVRLP